MIDKKHNVISLVMISFTIAMILIMKTTASAADSQTRYYGKDYSLVYDESYYLAHNADVKAAYGNDSKLVLSHFVNFGMAEGRCAKASFNVQYYKQQHSDLQQMFGNDLKSYYTHYINFGYYEYRDASLNEMLNHGNYNKIFDAQFYYDKYPDLQKTFGDDESALFSHFINFGMAEGRQACTDFNISIYKKNYSDLAKSFGNNYEEYFQHYINFGYTEGRVANVDIESVYNGINYALVYDKSYYAEHNPDVIAAYTNSLDLDIW